ncbi:hypothetical protein ALO88_200088 [Pseudomonas syringae pv. antirrhini]|uniref:Uncharacterized protein n=1 Tax=Pseudomonas syringae pv. antirrhini TaxID=251702 RepID=A0A0P9JXY3_9PSED|nr:hypothetical protein ALO88_200088 [Pseudomonas syringae pv. antirrhini]
MCFQQVGQRIIRRRERDSLRANLIHDIGHERLQSWVVLNDDDLSANRQQSFPIYVQSIPLKSETPTEQTVRLHEFKRKFRVYHESA